MDAHHLEKYAEICDIVSEKLNQMQISLDAARFCLKLMRHSRFIKIYPQKLDNSMMIFLLRFANGHILYLKTTEVAFENYLLEIEQVNEKFYHDEVAHF